MPVSGGAWTAMIDWARGGGTATWLADNTIVFGGEGRGLMRMPAAEAAAYRGGGLLMNGDSSQVA